MNWSRSVRSFGRRVVVPYYESIGIPDFGRGLIRDYWDSERQIEAIAEDRVLVACADGEIIGVIEHDRDEDKLCNNQREVAHSGVVRRLRTLAQ